MNLSYLKNFVEVAKVGGLLKAAKIVYLSQSALSHQLQQLEKETGYRLIERDRNHFAITIAGKRFLHFAELVCNEYNKLEYDLSQIGKGIHGNLNIMASPIIGESLLPSIINDFTSNHSAVNIHMKIADSFEVINAIQSQENTVGFCGINIEQKGLEYLKIGEDEVVLAVYPDHRFCAQDQVTLSDLKDESLILRYDINEEKPHYITSLFKSNPVLSRYKPKLVIPTIAGIISAVEAKMGIALVAYLAVKKCEDAGLIKTVKIKELKLKRSLFCIYRSNADAISPIKDFIGFIKSKYQSINMADFGNKNFIDAQQSAKQN